MQESAPHERQRPGRRRLDRRAGHLELSGPQHEVLVLRLHVAVAHVRLLRDLDLDHRAQPLLRRLPVQRRPHAGDRDVERVALAGRQRARARRRR